MKLVLQDLPPLAARGAAALLAAIGLALAARMARLPMAVPPSERGALVLAALLNFSAWMGFSTVGLLWLTGSEGAILAATLPIWATLLAWPLLGEKPSAQQVLALVLGLGGVIVLMGGAALNVGAAKLPGAALMLTAALCFSLGAVLSKRRPIHMHPVSAVVWQVGLGSLPMLGGSLLLESPDWAHVSLQGWGGVVFMALMPLSVCYITWFAALRRLPAGTAATGMLLTPVIGTLSSAAALGEPLGLPQIAALALTLASVLLVSRR